MNEKDCKVVVKRYEYEEPYHAQLEFQVSNGRFSASVDFYCNVEDIKSIGRELLNFPQKIGDECCYTCGSEKPEDRCYRLFVMRAYTLDSKGHCALQFKINLNGKEPSEGQAVFSLPVEAHAINRLGGLFVTFSELKHKEFHWTNKDDALFADYQSYSF